MTPRLESCYFGSGRHGEWDRLANVLRFTAQAHCGTWNVNVQRIDPKAYTSAIGLRPNEANTQKLESWLDIVEAAPDGQQLLLIDADTAILRPLDDVWGEDFDLAYTTKRKARFPFNGGVVFVRVSPAIRTFFAQWWQENVFMLGHATHHQPFRKRYGGLNQAAFGALLERRAAAQLKLLELPCAEWNCEDASWSAFDPERTRILHIKTALTGGDLRRTLFARWPAPPHIQQLATLWKDLEAQSLVATRRTA